MSMTTTVTIATRSRTTIEDITPQVQQVVQRSGVGDGLCTVYVPHTTAGVIINENYDASVKRDILATLNRLIPLEGDYQHSEGNSDAHVKASLVGASVTVPVSAGKLMLGVWQGILFCEFDGPRTRHVIIQVMHGGGSQ